MQKQTEQWKNIEGYEGLYQVSDDGRIRNSKGKILKGGKNARGYLYVALNKNGKQVMKKVHRLVAEAFLENPQNLPEVNHKDECKTNNNVLNLEWCDSKYNTNYGTANQRRAEKLLNRQDLSKRIDQIDAVTGEVIRQWASTMECGRNGYMQSHVSACARGERKTHKGYVWKYLQA